MQYKLIPLAALPLILAACGGSDRPIAASAAPTPAEACSALQGASITQAQIGLATNGAVVNSAQLVKAGDANNANGEYCLVKGIILPVDSASPNIEYQVNLPTNWNKKALQFGGGAYDGTVVTGLGSHSLQPSGEDTPLKQGYLTLGSDSGHKGSGFDASFISNDEALRNFGQLQIKKVHDVAVALAKTRYGSGPARFYFAGGSQGGHEALDAAARYPADYDGVIANYPAYNVALLHLGSYNVGKALYGNGGAGWFNANKHKLILNAAMNACDELDGVKDQLISNTQACNAIFNLDTIKATLRCAGGADTGDTCLSDAQIDTVRQITSDYKPGFAIAGMDTFPGWGLLEGAFQSGIDFGARAVPTNPPAGADAFLYQIGYADLRYAYVQNAGFDPLSFSTASYQARIQAFGAITDVTSVDLTPFRNKGGKIIMAHGTADQLITVKNSYAYYQRHLAEAGSQANMDSFFRFYVIPGLSHGGGPFNARYSGLKMLDAWVENKQPPAAPIVTDETAANNNRSRPMCQYGSYPKFTGAAGSASDAAQNYTCTTL